MLHEKLKQNKLSGEERIGGSSFSIGTISDYWKWAHSNIFDNTERGVFSEYIVASAMGITDSIRTEWDRYDLFYQDDVRSFSIEVKSASYLQSWGQTKFSKISFGISPTRPWWPNNGTYGEVSSRQANIYVFCLFASQDPIRANLMCLDQWEFRAVSTRVLNDRVGDQKRISLSTLDNLGASPIRYQDLRASVLRIADTL